MSQLYGLNIEFAREMQRARWWCVSIAMAAITVADGIWIKAFLEPNFYAFVAARKVMHVAIGVASASAIMWLAFLLFRPPRKKRPRAELATLWCSVVAAVVLTVSFGALISCLVAEVSSVEVESAVREAVKQTTMSFTMVALGGCIGAIVLLFTTFD